MQANDAAALSSVVEWIAFQALSQKRDKTKSDPEGDHSYVRMVVLCPVL